MKKILSGTTALVAAAGFATAAFAADAPPNTPVLGCAAMGGGYFAIPNGDGTCLAISGFVRDDQWTLPAQNRTSVSGLNTQLTIRLGVATKTMTDFGLVNTNIDFREYAGTNVPGNNPYNQKYNSSTTGFNSSVMKGAVYQAYIQFMGVTAGRHETFSSLHGDMLHNGSGYGADDWDQTAGGGWGTHDQELLAAANGENQSYVQLLAYSATVSPGYFVTVSAEDPSDERGDILQASSTTHKITGTSFTSTAATYTGNYYGSLNAPDGVVQFRTDANWGQAAIAGVLHEVNANQGLATVTNGQSAKVGYAATAAAVFAVPGVGNGKMDDIGFGAAYEMGAQKYAFQGLNNWNGWVSSAFAVNGLNNATTTHTGAVPVADAYIDTANGNTLTLTRGWAANVGGVHFFTPQLSISPIFSYGKITSGSGLSNITVATGTARFDYRLTNKLMVSLEGNALYLKEDAVGAIPSASAMNYVGWLRVERDF